MKSKEESDGEKTVFHKTLFVQSRLHLPNEIIKELNVIDIEPETVQLVLLLSVKMFKFGCLQRKLKLFSFFLDESLRSKAVPAMMEPVKSRDYQGKRVNLPYRSSN